ncbi:hypothetical protein DM01DRAFT_1346953 [Hesseltinella vesiculosa]|uniref:Pentacotripeptide-repeat region of PRORP domain-containing protein n=1 Tax=Hesseltinella vesiculosa TaxID=101127 RepID=A0A1X2GE40_9FUNG|nr:hypothetical protein DM01DRAFT_1346953 [Hesseltinella vesiculosa]
MEEIPSENIPPVNLDPFVARLLEQPLEQGQLEAAWAHCEQLTATSWYPSFLHNRRFVKATLVMCCAKQQWRLCEEILRQRHIDMTSKTVARMIHTLIGLNHHQGSPLTISGRQIVRAIQSFERILNIQLNMYTVTKIMRYLGQVKPYKKIEGSAAKKRSLKIDDAYRLYCWVRGEIGIKHHKSRSKLTVTGRASSSQLYLTMIDIAMAHNRTDLAERAWHHRMYSGSHVSSPTIADFRPANLFAYNLLLNIYANELPAPNLDRIQRTYRRLIQHGHTPDVITYNTIIKALVNAGKATTAMDVLESMVASKPFHYPGSSPGEGNADNEKRCIQPDQHTVNLVLQGWVDHRNWSEVEGYVKRIQELDLVRHFDIISFNIMVRGFLHLDGQLLAEENLYKQVSEWSSVKRLQRSAQPFPLSSTAIWEIFESTTGHQRHHLLTCLRENSVHPCPTNERYQGFQEMFHLNGTDPSTCKLFIKAFSLAKDPRAASLVTKWMFRRPPSEQL